MGHIFISYSRKDEQYVSKLVEALENEGFEVWVDRELLTGDTWIQVINHKIDTCDAFVIVMTDSSKESSWVTREVLYAIQENKKIFPLLLQGKLWMLLQNFNYFKVTDDSIPDRKFFSDLEKHVPRSETWLTAQLEKKQQEAAEKEAHKKAEKDAAEKIAREKAEKDAIEKAQREAEELAKQKTAKEKEERQTIEKAAQEKLKRDASEKAKRERAERQTAQIAALKETLFKSFTALKSNLPKAIPFLRIAGFAGIAIALFWIGSWELPKLASLVPTPKASLENTLRPSITFTFTVSPQLPTQTVAPKLTSTKTLTPVPTVILQTEITDTKGVSMVLVPAGEFTMGNDNGNGDPFDGPVHKINLNSFYVDKYEVTNGHYKDCVVAGVCQAPTQRSSMKIPSYYGSTKFKDYPVTWVDWNMAKTYCEWRGAHLPTEAEWEKAARGIDGREFPWGKVGVIIDKTYANYGNLVGDFTSVGSYEKGKSPYGAYDMAGNVFEWVADWFSWDYYSISPYQNPLGPDTGDYHVYRGGGVGSDPAFVRTTSRQWFDSSLGSITLGIGIRCARDANP